jgi:hypothetical protein
MLIKDTRVMWIMMVIQQGLGPDEPYIGEEQVEDLASRYQM